MLRARRLRSPRPHGTSVVDHAAFAPILSAVAAGGVTGLSGLAPLIDSYVTGLSAVDPDDLSRAEAKAFWINLYNALALDLARRARSEGSESVLGLPGAFDRPVIGIAGESLSLDGIEHGKIRRFGDPRIHSALVCGSISCPSLRFEPFDGDVEEQLEAQMRSFVVSGAAIPDRSSGTLHLSRVFRWYGSDFVRPDRMPTLLPSRRRTVAGAVAAWLPEETRAWLENDHPSIEFLPYDWALGCSVRSPF